MTHFIAVVNVMKPMKYEFSLDCMTREAFLRRWCLNWNLNNVHTQRKVYPETEMIQKFILWRRLVYLRNMLVGEELREISGIGGNLIKAFYTGHGKHLGFYSTSNKKLLEDLKEEKWEVLITFKWIIDGQDTYVGRRPIRGIL